MRRNCRLCRHDDVGGEAIDERHGLRRVARLAGGQSEASVAARAAHRQMDFGRQAAARTADGLICTPPFCAARVLVRPDDARVDNHIFEVGVARPRLEQAPPNARGASTTETTEHAVPFATRFRQLAPRRTRAHVPGRPSMNIRLSRPVEPRWFGLPIIIPEIPSHWPSLSTSRPVTPNASPLKEISDQASTKLGIARLRITAVRDGTAKRRLRAASLSRPRLTAASSSSAASRRPSGPRAVAPRQNSLGGRRRQSADLEP